jgi:putative salt-induced outer membrane protein YdiY
MNRDNKIRWLFIALLAGAISSGALRAQQAPPAEPKKPAWDTSVGLGFTLTRGNSDTLLLNANVLAQKKWEQNELSLGADGSYGENDGEKNVESVRGFGQYNRLFTDRFYGYGRVEAMHDAIADVEYRVTLSPGVGYYFIKNDRTKLSGEFGPSYVLEKLGSDTHDFFALRFAEKFEHKLNDRARIWQSVEYLPQVDDFNNYLLVSELGVESGLTKQLSLRVYLQDTYDNEPAPGREKNDFKLIAGVAYKFL